jgi:hypothetical protein
MLSPEAQKILKEYFNLPFPGVGGVRCPYFNNARLRQRAQLRVLVGKGTPKEIVDEAQIISLQYHAGLFDKSGACCLHGEHEHKIAPEEIRKFLIDHNLGIECSGFVTQILRAHFKEAKNIDIAQRFCKVSAKNFLRFLICKLRPIENISVKTYADDRNTKIVNSLGEIQPGDVIVLLGIKTDNGRNHILLVTENGNGKIKYVHARTWTSEGKYGHGVAEGEIEIVKPDGNLLEQNWVELGKTGNENETLREAAAAEKVEVRRVGV